MSRNTVSAGRHNGPRRGTVPPTGEGTSGVPLGHPLRGYVPAGYLRDTCGIPRGFGGPGRRIVALGWGASARRDHDTPSRVGRDRRVGEDPAPCPLADGPARLARRLGLVVEVVPLDVLAVGGG